MFIKKCEESDFQTIIKIADKAFKPERVAGFSFKKSKPQIYNNPNKNYANIHFLAYNDKNQPVAVVGNLIDKIIINKNPYKFSRLGTVGTIPDYRGQSYMKSLMSATNQEDLENEVVFSVLTGNRERYNHYKYERIGLTANYEFNKNQTKYLKHNQNISIKPFKEEFLETIYNIYRKNELFVLRDIFEFKLSLNNSHTKLYAICDSDKIVGYFAIKNRSIIEINVTSSKYIEPTICQILLDEKITTKEHNYTIKIIETLLHKHNCYIFDKLADFKTLSEHMCLKIYNFEKFVEMIVYLNNLENPLKSFSETYEVEGQIYTFDFDGNIFKMSKSKKHPLCSFETKEEFVRFMLGNELLYNNISEVFPLAFDINIADRF